MIINCKIRVKLGILAIICAMILSIAQSIVINKNLFAGKLVIYNDMPTKRELIDYEKKLNIVKKSLPKYGKIGYLTDDKLKAFNRDSKYFFAQYVLSPLVLVNSTQHKLILGNFYSKITPDIYKKHSLVLIKDFGDGLMLFERVTE